MSPPKTQAPQELIATDISSADISRLVGCCPGLQHLDIDLQQQQQPGSGVQLAALSQLTALTSLGVWRANEASVKSMSGLTQLKHLSVGARPPFSAASLLQLMALQQLTSLEVDPDHGVELAGAEGISVCLCSRVSIRAAGGAYQVSMSIAESAMATCAQQL